MGRDRRNAAPFALNRLRASGVAAMSQAAQSERRIAGNCRAARVTSRASMPLPPKRIEAASPMPPKRGMARSAAAAPAVRASVRPTSRNRETSPRGIILSILPFPEPPVYVCPMATYAASIKKALTSQSDLLTHEEHCSADPEKLARLGRAVGQQVRVIASATQLALYTVSETRQENPDSIIRMGQSGRARLGTGNELAATVDGQVPHPTYSDTEAQAHDEFVERLTDNGLSKNLIACAPHGGMIEPYTDKQAEQVAAQLATKAVSCWRCKGYKAGGGAGARWHITSCDISGASF